MAKLNCTVPHIPCHLKSSNGWLVYYKHTCDDDWNHPVVDKAATGVIEMPSTVQSITSLSFSRSHSSFARLKCPFPRKPRCARGWTCGSGNELRQFDQTKGDKLDVLQHNVFLLITQADTNSRQEPYTFPTNARKKTYLVDSQPLTHCLCRDSSREKDHPSSGIIGTVQDDIENSV